MLRRDAYRIGGKVYYLSAEIADQVTNLRLSDHAAAMALADRHGHAPMPSGGSVTIPIHLQDGDTKMQTIVVDGKSLSVTDEAAAVIQGLQGQNAALSATLRDRAADQVKDAGANAMSALRAEDAATKDVKTPAGAAAQRLRDAWKASSNA